MFRTSDSLENNYLLDFTSYRFTHESKEDGVFWIGLIVDEKSQHVLDCKWWTPRMNDPMAKLCQAYAVSCIGQTLDNCPPITPPNSEIT
jgi:hypothetical protein